MAHFQAYFQASGIDTHETKATAKSFMATSIHTSCTGRGFQKMNMHKHLSEQTVQD